MYKNLFQIPIAFLLIVLSVLIYPHYQTVSAKEITTTAFEAYFSNFDTSLWSKADWSNGSIFNCVWRPSQVSFSDGNMILQLDKDGTGSQYPYKSGEYRTNSYFGYGFYEVRMKPAKNVGTVSSFFTYTGPYDGDPWDEIDIEFIGKDTTVVQFNWWKDGVGGNEYYHDLGFDASQSFHTYGFEWRENYINFYVDGVKVYTGTQNIPRTPGRIMMNLWPGIGVDSWLGAYDGVTPLTAEYKYVKYSPDGAAEPTNMPTQTPTPTPTPTSTNNTVIKGDLNRDKSVDSTDLTIMKRYLLKIITDFPYSDGLQASDVNGDGSTDSIDLTLMKRYILRIITSFDDY